MRQITLTIFVALAITCSGPAAQVYWDGGSSNLPTNGDAVSQGGGGTWDTTIQNWDFGAGVPHGVWNNVLNLDAVFAGEGGVVTLGGVIKANSVTLGADGYVITDGGAPENTLELNSVVNNATSILGANVVNSGTFTADGGITILTNTSPGLTGGLVVNSGTLQLGDGATAGPGAFGSVTVASGATLKVNQPGTASFAQTISGAGSVSVQANNSNTRVYLDGYNTFTGDFTIDRAMVTLATISDTQPNALGLGTNINLGVGNDTASLLYEGLNGNTITKQITLCGRGGKFIWNNGVGSPLVWLGPVAFGDTNKQTFTLAGSHNYDIFGGVITDNTVTNTAVAKTGAGVWLLAAANTFSGGLTVANGVLMVTNQAGLGAPNNPISLLPASTGVVPYITSASNSVTIGAGHEVFIGGQKSGTSGVGAFGVRDVNNLYVEARLTGTGAVVKAASGASLGWVRFSNDASDCTGDFVATWGNTEFTSVADQGQPSSLGSGAQILLNNGNSGGTLRFIGTTDRATHRPVVWNATTGAYALQNNGSGTLSFLNTAPLVSGNGAKTLALQGTNPGANVFAQTINDAPNATVTSLTKSQAGRWILTGNNTYSGVTTISGGTLEVSGDANLGTAPDVATARRLIITSGTLSASAGFTLNANRGIALGPSGATVSGNGTISVAQDQTLIFGGVMANNTSTNVGGLIKAGAGTLALSGANTYGGDTRINGGILALIGGSIANSPNIIIASGSTFDVSGGYTLATGQALRVTNNATIKGSLNVAAASMVLGVAFDGASPVAVTDGSLTLGGATALTLNINNGGVPLGAGSYKIIAAGSGGSVVGVAPNFTVGGDGLADGTTVELVISSGELFLSVTGGTLTPPVVDSFGAGGGGVVLTFSGPSGQSWRIISSENVEVPLASWVEVASGQFTGTAVSYTNASLTEAKRFYRLVSP